MSFFTGLIRGDMKMGESNWNFSVRRLSEKETRRVILTRRSLETLNQDGEWPWCLEKRTRKECLTGG